MDDAVDLLKHDHRMVEQLFRDYHAAASDRQRRAVVETLVRELAKHAAVEELIFYPFAAAVLEDESLVGRHLHEHATVKHLLAELDGLKEGDERTGELMERLRDDVEEHIRDEENGLMRRLRDAAGDEALRELAPALRDARRRAPTRPHPAAPDRPPALALAAPAAAAYDRLRDRLQRRPRA